MAITTVEAEHGRPPAARLTVRVDPLYENAPMDPADLAARVALLEDLAAQVERLSRSVSLGASDLEPALLDALDRLQRVTAELRH